MAFNGYRDKALQDRMVLDRLARGQKPRKIAADLGCSYSTLRRRLSRYVRAIGCATPEEAVAKHVAGMIKARLPLALQPIVDRILAPQSCASLDAAAEGRPSPICGTDYAPVDMARNPCILGTVR